MKGISVDNYKRQYNCAFLPFLLLTNLKSNSIKQYLYNCIVGSITHRNETYLKIAAQNRQERRKLYWDKKMTQYDNSKP